MVTLSRAVLLSAIETEVGVAVRKAFAVLESIGVGREKLRTLLHSGIVLTNLYEML